MSLQVTGKATVHKVQDKGKFVVASLRTSKKDQNGEWQSEWFNGKFVGEAAGYARGLCDKDKVNLTKAVLEQRKHNGKEYVSVVVFAFDALRSDGTGGCSMPMDGEDELPF